MSVALHMLAFLACLVAGPAARSELFLLEPDRVWDAVGRVNVPHGFCTGTLVGRAEVLTAAHCLYDRKRRRFYGVDEVHFVAGFRRGDYAGHSRILGVRMSPELLFDSDVSPTRRDNYGAVLSIGPSGVADAGVAPLAVGSPEAWVPGGPARLVSIVGYTQQRPYLPVMEPRCQIVDRPQGAALVLHSCPMPNGMSGAPVLMQDRSGWHVLGIHVASVNWSNRRVGAAVTLRRSLPANALR